MIRPSLTILILSAICLQTGTAAAHPHVRVTMMSELIYAADGSVSGVRHNWTFDDMFSVFATQGLESKKRDVFTREELAPLAEVNVTSLKEYAFFTFAKADGKKLQLSEPVDYYLDYDPKRTVLTLHFTLPFKAPVKAKQLNVDIYDPTYFVDFAFAEKSPMALVGAPAACKFSITRPDDATAQVQRLPETFFNSLAASGGWGTQFADKVSVKCPWERGRERATRQLVVVAIVFIAVLFLTGLIETAWAQNSPFVGLRSPGAPRPASAGGIVGWLFAKQAEFYRQFSGVIRSAKADGSAVWSLLGVSFLYGVFHAAGPGHGKAVISSYVVANGETWIRGVVLSLASALLQALAAIAIVGVAAALLNARASTMNGAVNLIESASYALIIIIGLRLLWVKGRIFLSALGAARHPISEAGAAVTSKHDDHDHDDRDPAGHRHAHAHHEDTCCADHAPPPQELGGAGGWRRGLTAIVAVGLRPCSGAILVLVFAMAQGLFWVGAGSALVMGLGTFITVATIATVAVMARDTASRLVAARSRHGALAIRGIEVAAAAAITGFGVLLLCGYLVN